MFPSGFVSVRAGALSVVTNVAFNGPPIGVAVDPLNNLVYTTIETTDVVVALDGTTNAVKATVNVGRAPTGIAFDAAKWLGVRCQPQRQHGQRAEELRDPGHC